MSPAKILKISSLAFIAGVGVASFFKAAWLANDLLWFGLATLIFIGLVIVWSKKSIYVRLIILGLLFFTLGIWRYALSLPIETPDKVWYYNGQSVVVVGVANNEPDVRDKSVKLEIKSEKLNGQPVQGEILVTTNLYPEYKYGDRLRLNCILKTPEEFNGFAYDRYLARYDIFSVCYYPKIILLESGQGNYFFQQIFLLKDKFRSAINRGLVEPEAGLINAIILGDRKGLPADLQQAFARTGLSHIIAISGLNISILSVIIMTILIAIGLNRRAAFYFAVGFFAVYIVLVGAPASAVRAGVMGFLVLWAAYLGRINQIDRAVILAGAMMLLFNPRLLRDDIGWQLSFLAILSLVYFYPLLIQLYQGIRSAWLKKILDIISITVAAQILTWPIIVYHFSVFSIVAPLANLLVLWSLPWQMSAALIGIILGLIFPNWSSLIFLPVFILTAWLIKIAEVLSSWPLSFVMIGNLPIIVLIIYYFLVSIFIFLKRRRKTNIETSPILTTKI